MMTEASPLPPLEGPAGFASVLGRVPTSVEVEHLATPAQETSGDATNATTTNAISAPYTSQQQQMPHQPSLCFATPQRRALAALVFLGLVVIITALYFTLPWVPILKDILYWIDTRPGIGGGVLLFTLHFLAILSVFGPIATLEYGWIFLWGWKRAIPFILLSYILAMAIMLVVGKYVLRPCIVHRVRGNHLFRATQRVLDRHPYSWYLAFQFWGLIPWRITVYCAHVLAPHASLFGIGVAVFIGRFPEILYRAFLASKIKDLDSLVTGQLETPLDTGIFWGSVTVSTIISIILYIKIRDAFIEAAGLNHGTDGDTNESSTSIDDNDDHDRVQNSEESTNLHLVMMEEATGADTLIEPQR
jgi:uncharacterized membrane protein YdjX (TVP38/TMEM64 family)